jgi:hypothetical protein
MVSSRSTGHYMIISTNLFSPSSRTCILSPSHIVLFVHIWPGGSVTLNSNNPFDFPIVDPAFLSTDFDIFTITEAVKAAQRFMAASPWNGFVLKQFGNFANVTTDEQIAAYARNNAASVFHPVGTAFMSAANAHNGVVNPDLTVKNTVGLRVVDASIFVSDQSRCLRQDRLVMTMPNAALHSIDASSGFRIHNCGTCVDHHPE